MTRSLISDLDMTWSLTFGPLEETDCISAAQTGYMELFRCILQLVRYDGAVSVEALDRIIKSSIFWAEVHITSSLP